MEWVKSLSSRIGAAGSRLLLRETTARSEPPSPQQQDRTFAGVSLLSLIAWLETQPAEQPYEYTAPDRCALAQYLKDLGNAPLDSFVDFGAEPQSEDEGFWLWEIVGTPPWTFGAALERARKAALSGRGGPDSAHVPPASMGVPWSAHV
jgi:hypothetical protein